MSRWPIATPCMSRWPILQCCKIGHRDMHGVAVGLGIDRNRAQAHGAGGADHTGCDLAAIGDQEGAKSPVLGLRFHHHIRNRPKRVGSIGALADAERPRPSTSLVSAGLPQPSSPSPRGPPNGAPFLSFRAGVFPPKISSSPSPQPSPLATSLSLPCPR